MHKKSLKFLGVMSKDITKSLTATTLMVTFSTSVFAHTQTATNSVSEVLSQQADNIVMPIATNGTNNQGFKNLDDVPGLTIGQIKANKVTSGTFPDDDMNKIFFLYNVQTGKFINAGGYWGTHISLKDYPLSLWANTNTYTLPDGTDTELIDFEQNMDTGHGQYIGWVGTDDAYHSTNPSDFGVFIDRSKSDQKHYGWVFEPIDSDTKNTYKIYTYQTNKPDATSTKQYLCAKKGGIDQNKNCEALNSSTINKEGLEGYDHWRVMSMQQISDLLKKSSDNMTSALDLSYRLDCPGFSRGDKNIYKWKLSKNFAKGTDGGIRFGLEKLYNKTPKADRENYDYDFKDKTSYTFDNKTYTARPDYQRILGKYFCADAKNVRGSLYQDVEIITSGSYIIECKGYSTTPKAKIFATLLDKDGKEIPHSVHQTVLNQVSYMSAEEQETLHISEQNMDYAGKNFYGQRKYINTVLVQVPEGSNYGYIRFGLTFGDDANDTDASKAVNEWTVFDDFRLLYASQDKSNDLILDEDRDELKYLQTCSNTYKNKVLHLNKTFTKDRWNSFILPVSLKRDQFRQAFGANARLAVLSHLTSSEIQFQSIDMDNMADDEVVLKSYIPYIIFPTNLPTELEESTPAYTANLTQTKGESKMLPVVVKAGHYDIPNVTMETNSDNQNDLTYMNTETWTTTKISSITGDGTMEAHGTFARTFCTDATQNKEDGKYSFNNHNIIDGRDNLINSFFFDKGNLYYSSSKARGLRGFSCWFKPVDSSSANKLNLYIDGVSNGTTGIDEVVFGDEQPTGKAARGIFNMNGQLVSNGTDTTNLPAGIYIVNGKKCVVR